MKKYIFAIVLIIFIQRFYFLRPNDFCNLIKKECIGTYDKIDNYKVECHQDPCPSSHTVHCGESRCANNRTKCSIYLELTADSNRFDSRFRRSVQIQNNYKERLKRFQRRIPNCTSKAYVYRRKDVCIRLKNCFKRDEIKFAFNMNGMQMYLKKNKNKFICPCRGNLTYVCANANYCSLNQFACDSFISKQNKSIGLQKCRNNFLLLN